jgi:hypothetical protein
VLPIEAWGRDLVECACCDMLQEQVVGLGGVEEAKAYAAGPVGGGGLGRSLRCTLLPLNKCNSGSKCRGFFVWQLDRARLVLRRPAITFIQGRGEYGVDVHTMCALGRDS